MRASFAIPVFVLGLLSSGCSLVGTATHNVAWEVGQTWQDHDERTRDRQLAQRAWDQFRGEQPDGIYSQDYAEGFQDGFADFLYAGGSGEPPPLPPRRYWKTEYETPRGNQAIEDWFAGFRRGAAAAQQSGYRRYMTVPAAVACAIPVGPLPPGPVVVPAHEGDLPAPQPAPAPEGTSRAPAQPDGRPPATAVAVADGPPPLTQHSPRARVVHVTPGEPMTQYQPRARVLRITPEPPAPPPHATVLGIRPAAVSAPTLGYTEDR